MNFLKASNLNHHYDKVKNRRHTESDLERGREGGKKGGRERETHK